MRRGKGLRIGALGLLAAAIAAPAASANTISPNTTLDQANTVPGQCSLREAVSAANSNAPYGGCPAGGGASDTINLGPGVFQLSLPGNEEENAGGDLDINTGVISIVHSGPGRAVIDGGDLDGVVQVG